MPKVPYCKHRTKVLYKVYLIMNQEKEQIGNSEPFPVANLPVLFINSEQIGIREQFWDNLKVPYCQVWL